MTAAARSKLTPAMRACLGTAPAAADLRLGPIAEPGLSGLYHDATLAALERHGLAVSTWDAELDTREYRLNDAGLAARALLRARVDELLCENGCPKSGSGRYLYPGCPEVEMTRAAAMRRTGVKW